MSVKVAVRVRPFNPRETELGCQCCVEMDGNGRTTLIDCNMDNKRRDFTFDYSFWSHDGFKTEPNGMMVPMDEKYSDQKLVYEKVGVEVLNNAWEGYHTCLFAYGQTGAGKSYSMLGYGVNKGIVPISCEEIFSRISKNDNPKKSYEVLFSMLEIYNEKIQDLLIPVSERPNGGLKVRENKTHGVFVENLSKWPVHSYNQIEEKMELGSKHRSVASTMMNASSSRAHTIITIEFKQIMQEEKRKAEKLSVINLVDLAGSEKIAKTGASGDRLKEGCSINLSLTVLGVVIAKLADLSTGKGKGVVVPYRDSALTRILQNALGGNSKTLMICAISPATDNYEETLSTLRYADQAKKIKNHAVVNESETDKMIRLLKEENDKLKNFLEAFANKQSVAPEILSSLGINMGLLADANGGSSELTPTKEGSKRVGSKRSSLKHSTEDLDEKILKIRELEEQLEANNILMQEYQTSYDDKVTHMNQLEQKEAATPKDDLTVPHLTNLNEDLLLNGKIYFNLKEHRVLHIGKKNGNPKPEIILSAIGIQPNHAIIKNEDERLFIEPFSHECGEHLHLNGENVFKKTELFHLDRILIGTSTVLLFKYPSRTSQQRQPKVDESEIDWEFAQKEMALFSEKISKLKEKEMDAKKHEEKERRIQELEAELKRHQEERERELKAEFEERILEIQKEGEADEAEKLELESEFNEQLRRMELEMVQKEIEVEKKKREILDEDVISVYKAQERAFFESQLAEVLPKITEANLMAKELKRNCHFSIKLFYGFVESFDLKNFGEKQRKRKIQVKVVNNDYNCTFFWSLKTFKSRYFIIKDLLDAYFETNIVPVMEVATDPFWDPPAPRFIGQGLLKLVPVCYNLDNPCEIMLVGEQGKVGRLNVNLIPCSPEGKPLDLEEAEFIEDPRDLVGRDLHFYVSIESGVAPVNSCKNTYCEYYMLGGEGKKERVPFRTKTVEGIHPIPKFEYMQKHSFQNMDETTLNFLLNHNLSILLYGFDNDSNLETPKEPLPKIVVGSKNSSPLRSPMKPPPRNANKPRENGSNGLMGKLNVAQMDTGVKPRSGKNEKKKKDDCNVF